MGPSVGDAEAEDVRRDAPRESVARGSASSREVRANPNAEKPEKPENLSSPDAFGRNAFARGSGGGASRAAAANVDANAATRFNSAPTSSSPET